MKHEKMETQMMVMDATATVQLLNILMYVQEVLKQARIHAQDVNKVSIKTTRLIQNSEFQDVEMEIEQMMKTVMMAMTMMAMDVHLIDILRRDGSVLVETQPIKIIVVCARLCLSQTRVKLNVRSKHKTQLLAILFLL